jgi:hypothetical protein
MSGSGQAEMTVIRVEKETVVIRSDANRTRTETLIFHAYKHQGCATMVTKNPAAKWVLPFSGHFGFVVVVRVCRVDCIK